MFTMADSTWIDRLEDARERKGVSLRALSISMGRAPGYVHSLIKEGKRPSIDNMVAIADQLGVSLNWLVFGVEMTADAERLLRLYSGLDTAQQENFLRMAEAAAALAEKTSPQLPSKDDESDSH